MRRIGRPYSRTELLREGADPRHVLGTSGVPYFGSKSVRFGSGGDPGRHPGHASVNSPVSAAEVDVSARREICRISRFGGPSEGNDLSALIAQLPIAKD
jgi:hypothetical protein